MQVNFNPFANLMLLLQGSIFIILLLTASLFDIKKRIIPDTICLLLALTGFICFEPVKLLGCFSAMLLLVAALIWGGMGGGDIKLMAAAGLVLGFQKGMAALIIGLIAMLLFYAVYAIIQKLCKRKCQKAFPLVPFLSIGCIIAYFMNGGITL
jgi:leader peptidase (prepilin peptidase)/N-methyltransferase